jgi:predicted ester cyclase
MSNDEPKAIVLEFYKAFDDRAIDHAFGLLADERIAHLAGMPTSLDAEEFKQFGLSFYTAFTQGQHSFNEIIVDLNTVVTWGTFTATHTGVFLWFVQWFQFY